MSRRPVNRDILFARLRACDNTLYADEWPAIAALCRHKVKMPKLQPDGLGELSAEVRSGNIRWQLKQRRRRLLEEPGPDRLERFLQSVAVTNNA